MRKIDRDEAVLLIPLFIIIYVCLVAMGRTFPLGIVAFAFGFMAGTAISKVILEDKNVYKRR